MHAQKRFEVVPAHGQSDLRSNDAQGKVKLVYFLSVHLRSGKVATQRFEEVVAEGREYLGPQLRKLHAQCLMEDLATLEPDQFLVFGDAHIRASEVLIVLPSNESKAQTAP